MPDRSQPRSLSNRVRRAAPLLRSVGVEVHFKKSGQRSVFLEKTRNRPSTPSEPSVDRPHLDGVDGTDGAIQVDSGSLDAEALMQPCSADDAEEEVVL